jgi:signal transduction histidine kinase
MNLRFRSWKLKYKLLLVCLLLSIVPLIVMGLSCYFLADRALYKQIEEKLVIQAGYYRTLLTDNMATARTDTDARVNAQTIVKQQAEILTKFFRLAGNANLEDLKNAVASLVVGKTGYVYVLDYAGRYVVSKGRQRDGDNIYGSTDANGRFFIQEILKRAGSLRATPWISTFTRGRTREKARPGTKSRPSSTYQGWVGWWGYRPTSTMWWISRSRRRR